MIFPLANLEKFCATLPIPAKDHSGRFVMQALYSTQRYFFQELAAGLERGVHDFLILKGRQQGITKACDALDLYWPQRYEGIQGMMVADDDDSREVRRDEIRQMYYGMDDDRYRVPLRADNEKMLAWSNGSRLLWSQSATRQKGAKTKLGRGRGLSYLHADEFDAWTDPRAVMGLRASRSDRHPCRLYTWASTAQGYGVLWAAWREHEHSATTRRVFIPAWRHDLNYVQRANRAVWDLYGSDRLSEEERLWLHAVRGQYDVDLPPEYVVWYRWKLAEDMHGDEAMMAQEHPNLPEDAFQSMGDKFFRPALIRQLRESAAEAPEPHGYTYEWGKWLDTTTIHPADPHADDAITVWEEPDPEGVYIIACHPAYSSSADAPDDVVQVWRAYPDQLVQVAEYVASGGDLTVRCAWACLHLAGAYRQARAFADVYFVMDVEMTGFGVLREIERFESRNWGMRLQGARDLQNLMGAVRHYYFRRPDSLSKGVSAVEWKSQSSFRPWLLNQIRDVMENGHVEIRSAALIDELQMVRRGGANDADVIGAGAGAEHSECRVLAAAMATEHWFTTVQPEIIGRFSPKEQRPGQDDVAQILVGNFLERVQRTGRGV
jgi:hypothetical protein